jgi:hypothetical protein
MMPNNRLGRACNNSGLSKPTCMPMKPKNNPFAASEKATGKPDNKNITSVKNMTGAMFAIRNSVMMFSQFIKVGSLL